MLIFERVVFDAIFCTRSCKAAGMARYRRRRTALRRGVDTSVYIYYTLLYSTILYHTLPYSTFVFTCTDTPYFSSMPIEEK